MEESINIILENINKKVESSFLGEEVAIDPEEFRFLLHNGGFLTEVNRTYNNRYYIHRLTTRNSEEGNYCFKTLTESLL